MKSLGDIHKENYIHSKLLEQPRNMYFQFNAEEKLLLFHYALGKPKHAKMKKNITPLILEATAGANLAKTSNNQTSFTFSKAPSYHIISNLC